MKKTTLKQRVTLLVALITTAMMSTACGQMTMRTWINVDEENSGGQVDIYFPGATTPIVAPVLRLQGGYLAEIVLDLRTLPGPMYGTINLKDVRMAGTIEGLVGNLCTWNDPDGSSGGTMMVDLLSGETSAIMDLDAKATTALSTLLGMAPMDFEQPLDFDLGAGFGLDQFLGAFISGSIDGLFATSTTMASEATVGPIRTVFNLDVAVTNGGEPPRFDADLAAYCAGYFSQQGLGDGTFYSVNAKSSYMRLNPKDDAKNPTIIDLAEIGAEPGDTLHLNPYGTYHLLIALADGNERRMGGVFSSTDELLPGGNLFRIPGAIDAGPNVNTWPSIFCLFGQCTDLGGDDIGQDFPIDPAINIVVPAGANFLFVAPIDGWRNYQDNTGLGFGIQVEVTPAI